MSSLPEVILESFYWPGTSGPLLALSHGYTLLAANSNALFSRGWSLIIGQLTTQHPTQRVSRTDNTHNHR